MFALTTMFAGSYCGPMNTTNFIIVVWFRCCEKEMLTFLLCSGLLLLPETVHVVGRVVVEEGWCSAGVWEDKLW